MNEQVQAVMTLKIELFTEIAPQEETVDATTVASVQVIRKLQNNGVTIDEAAGLSASRLRTILKSAKNFKDEENEFVGTSDGGGKGLLRRRPRRWLASGLLFRLEQAKRFVRAVC